MGNSPALIEVCFNSNQMPKRESVTARLDRRRSERTQLGPLHSYAVIWPISGANVDRRLTMNTHIHQISV